MVINADTPLHTYSHTLDISGSKSHVHFPLRTFFRESMQVWAPLQQFANARILHSRAYCGEYGRRDLLCWLRDTLYTQQLALTSPTSGGHSVDIVCSWTKAMEFLLLWPTVEDHPLSAVHDFLFTIFTVALILSRSCLLIVLQLWNVISGEIINISTDLALKLVCYTLGIWW
jgi:hypothetical protein